MRTSSHTAPPIVTEAATFIGIDYHKRYSVWHAIDAAGRDLGKGRIEHHSPHGFATLVKRWPSARVVFEASMNWHWLYEELELHMPAERLKETGSVKETGRNGVSVQLLDSCVPLAENGAWHAAFAFNRPGLTITSWLGETDVRTSFTMMMTDGSSFTR